MRLLLSALLLTSPLLQADPPPPVSRIPFDPRPFRTVLQPMEEMMMAGSILVRNATEHPVFVRVRFALAGGWHLEMGPNDQEAFFSEHVQRGIIATVSEVGVQIGQQAPAVAI